MDEKLLETESKKLLVGVMSGTPVALPLELVDTTVPASDIVEIPWMNHDIHSFMLHERRLIAILNRTTLVGVEAHTQSQHARVAVLNSGFGILFDDLDFVRELKLPHTINGQYLSVLDIVATTQHHETPSGSLPNQIFVFRCNNQTLGLHLSQLHHVRLTRPDELEYSTMLRAWCLAEAPEIPIYEPAAALGQASSSGVTPTPIRGQHGHIVFVNLTDGTNFGIVVNDGLLDDPGSPQECSVFEAGQFAEERTLCSGLALPTAQGSTPFAVINADRLFDACFRLAA